MEQVEARFLAREQPRPHLQQPADRRVTRPAQVAEAEMVQPPIDAVDHRVGLARVFVVQPSINQAPNDRRFERLALDLEIGHVTPGLADGSVKGLDDVEHHFNKRIAKTGEFKGDDEHVVIAVPPIVTREQFDAVQRIMTQRRPTTAHSQAYCGPTPLGGIIVCGQCGGAMTLRTGRGNGGQYRYYTCCTRARAGDTGCKGVTIREDAADAAVIDHLENRLLEPKRLASMMDNIIDRRDAFVQRRSKHIADLRKRATESEAKLQRLYQAIENGLTDPNDRSLKSRIFELREVRDGLEGEAARTAAAVERMGTTLTPALLRQFAKATREMLRSENGGYRRDLLKAVAQRVEVAPDGGLRISGCKVELLRTISANNGVESAALDVRTRDPGWRHLLDMREN